MTHWNRKITQSATVRLIFIPLQSSVAFRAYQNNFHRDLGTATATPIQPTTKVLSMHYRFKTCSISSSFMQVIALMIGLHVLAINQTAQAQLLPHSHARPDQVKIRHLHLDAKVDFDTKRISGSATLTLERTDPQAMLQIDADRLEIRSVKACLLYTSPSPRDS